MQKVQLMIYVKPNAKKTALVEITKERGIVIALHARPQEGEANKELILFLSQLLKLPKTSIEIQRGEHSRFKKVCVPLNATVQKLLDDSK